MFDINPATRQSRHPDKRHLISWSFPHWELWHRARGYTTTKAPHLIIGNDTPGYF